MKKEGFYFALICILSVAFAACQHSEETPVITDFTGNQSTYALAAASQYPISGTAVFKERKDGNTTIEITLKGISDNDQHPVHLHLGDIGTDKANIAALLTSVAGSTGVSSTIVTQLADETKVTYNDLIRLSACVKIHLASTGPEADIILAAGNVGSASSSSTSNGRVGVAVCKSY